MSYSRMVLEQVKHKIDEELYEEYRAQRPGYQNILDDAQRLSEQMTLPQAASQYRYMYDPESPSPSERGLIKAPSAQGRQSYRPATPASIASKGATRVLRDISTSTTDVPTLVGPDYDKLSDYQKEIASQSVSGVRGGLEGLDDTLSVPGKPGKYYSLTSQDFEEIGKRSAESARKAALDMERRLAQQSEDPMIAKKGTFNPAQDLERRTQSIAARRAAGEDFGSPEKMTPARKDMFNLIGDTEELARTGGATISNLRSDPQVRKFADDIMTGDMSDIVGASSKLAGSVPVTTVFGPEAGSAYAGEILQKELGKRISSLPDKPQVDQAAQSLSTLMKIEDPNVAKREIENFNRQRLTDTGNIIKDVASRRAQIKRREQEAARVLGKAGMLPGVGPAGPRGR